MASLVFLPLAITIALRMLAPIVDRPLDKHFGNKKIIITGLGTIIHELFHLMSAILFCHKITKVKLLNFTKFIMGKSNYYGYVCVTYKKNGLCEQAGNFLIGIAPCICYSILLLAIHKILFKTSVIQYGYTVKHILFATYSNSLNAFGPLGWRSLFYIIFIIITADACYDISDLDLKLLMNGIIKWILMVIIGSLVFMILGYSSLLSNLMWKFNTLWLTSLGYGIIYSIVSNIAFNIMSAIKDLVWRH